MRIILSLIICLLLTGCVTTRNQLKKYDSYKDYFKAGLYKNSTVGFHMEFDSSWNVMASYGSFTDDFRKLADRIKKEKMEMMAVGHTSNKLLWFRFTVEDADLPLEDYFNIIKDINSSEIDDDTNNPLKINGIDMMEWTYSIRIDKVEYKYREYQFNKDQYNVRLTFWTLPVIFESNKSKIEKVINTFDFL